MKDVWRPLTRVFASAGLLLLASSLLLLDMRFDQAGLWALMVVSVTAGFGHGALDVQLLLRRFSPPSRALLLGFAYLLIVVLLGGVLSQTASGALWLLLVMSIWHFGEDYERWDRLPANAKVLTRLVVGGAPVMLPILLSPGPMTALLQTAWRADDFLVWNLAAKLWLGLVVIWSVLYGFPRLRAARTAWYELAGTALLNLFFSPLMAFAIYFGVYHAPVHIWRVWRGRPASLPAPRFKLMSVGTSFFITALLGGVLWAALGINEPLVADAAAGLRWLVVALAALTLPHLVLVSLCARMLAADGAKRP